MVDSVEGSMDAGGVGGMVDGVEGSMDGSGVDDMTDVVSRDMDGSVDCAWTVSGCYCSSCCQDRCH